MNDASRLYNLYHILNHYNLFGEPISARPAHDRPVCWPICAVKPS
jgi:fructosamine-3-kinase